MEQNNHNTPPSKVDDTPINKKNAYTKLKQSAMKRKQHQQLNRLRNGDQWFVNHQPALLVTSTNTGNNIIRVAHYSNGTKRTLSQNDQVWCNKAPKPTQNNPSPIPIFDITGRPVNAVLGKNGVGAKGGSVRPPTRPLSFVHGVDKNLPGTSSSVDVTTNVPIPNTITKRLSFATPGLTATPTFGVGTQMEDQLIIPDDEFTHLPDETLREAIDALPEGLNPGQAVYILNLRDYRQLPKDDILTLLASAAEYKPTADLKLDFKIWWDSHAKSLGSLAKLTAEQKAMYVQAQAEVTSNCCPSDDEEEVPEIPQHEGVEGMEVDEGRGAMLGNTSGPSMHAVPPPAGLHKPSVSNQFGGQKLVTIPLDDFDASAYPECFKLYQPERTTDIDRIRARWNEAVRQALKHAQKALKRASIKEHVPYIEGQLRWARQLLSSMHLPDDFRNIIDPAGEMETSLVMKSIDPQLATDLERHMKAFSVADLTKAIHLELDPQLNVDDYLSAVTKIKMDVNYTGGDGKFAEFRSKFQPAFDRFAIKVGFSVEEREREMITTFRWCLPYPVRQRFMQATHKEFKNCVQPPTWQDTLRIAQEVDTEYGQDKRNAALVAQQSRAGGSQPGKGKKSGYLGPNTQDFKKKGQPGKPGQPGKHGKPGKPGDGKGKWHKVKSWAKKQHQRQDNDQQTGKGGKPGKGHPGKGGKHAHDKNTT
jgi:hypothetical protein